MKVLIAQRHWFPLWVMPDWVVDRLRADFPAHQFVYISDYGLIDREIPDAEVFIGWTLRPEQLAAARQLRWVHSPAAAVHTLIFPEFVASSVVLTNAREVHGPVVAEHVIALIFALAKRIPDCVNLQRQHSWGQQALWSPGPPPREVAGDTLGLVGLGSIGREVARRAAALGMQVVATREHANKPAENVSAVYGPAELPRLLAESDYVVLAAPTTVGTHKLINAATLAQMKSTAFLINVARGSLLDEVALAEVLRSRRIAGAALDVFDEEPLPAGSELWDIPNLLITPHSAGITEKLWERHCQLIRQNLRRYLAGEPLLQVVNKQKGY
jgi:phosphoglycerate dehydrogenase-like enzyme